MAPAITDECDQARPVAEGPDQLGGREGEVE